MANQDRVNFVWAESALTTIPPIPVSEVAYRDTTQTPEQMEVGQQYDTIYNSARHNQLLFLLTSVAKTLCENGIMPFLAGQEYSQYARCIFTDGKLYIASRAILANEQPYPTPGDDSGVWIVEETSENLVPNSRRVIAGTGLTGGGPLSSDVTLSAKLDGKTTTEADGAITVKDVAIGGNLEDLASKRGQIGTPPIQVFTKTSADDAATLNLNDDKWWVNGEYSLYLRSEVFSFTPVVNNTPLEVSGNYSVRLRVANVYHTGNGIQEFSIAIGGKTIRTYYRTRFFNSDNTFSYYPWREAILTSSLGDGIRIINGIISVPEYEGATASTAGTSGLVPPAAAGQQNHLLTGGGAYISKVPNATHADTADNATHANTADNATHANTADNSSAFAGRPWVESLYTNNASWLIGSVDEKLRPINIGSLTVYAATYANTATGLTYAFTKGSSLGLPPGGTWFVLSWWDGDGGSAKGNWSGGQIFAGGSSVGVSNGAFALRVA